MSDDQHSDDESSKKLVETDYSSKHSDGPSHTTYQSTNMSDIQQHSDDESSKKLVGTDYSSKVIHDHLKSFSRMSLPEPDLLCKLDATLSSSTSFQVEPPALLSPHKEFETKSRLLQKKEFQTSEDEINSSLNQKLDYNLFQVPRDLRFSHIDFAEKCELVIKPKQSSQMPYIFHCFYKTNFIKICGLKGTGKTNLTKKLSTEALNKIKPRYIFYFNCSNLDLNKETTLLEFLSENIYINSPEKTLDNETLNKLEHSSRVFIVIDDAMNIKSTNEPSTGTWSTYPSLRFGNDDSSSSDLKQINLTDTGHNHLSRILNGEIMPESNKIVTCLLNVPLNSCLPLSKNIFLVGLSHNSQLKIFKSFGDKNEQNVEKYLQNHPGLLDFCYMLDICFLTGHCINELLTSTLQTSLPISLTDIFVYLLDKLISDTSLFDFNLLTEICDLSWHGIKNNKTEFDLNILSETSLKSQSLKNLSAKINGITFFLFKFSSPNTFHFTISLLQEFFAAIHLIFMMPFDEFKMLISTKSKGQMFDLYNYQNKYITRFMFGLCNDVTFKSLHKINSSFFNSTDKMSLLHTIACEASSPIKILDNTILQHLAWVHELHNHSYTQKLASRFSNEIKVDCQFYQEDISAFFYVLQARHEPVTITALIKDNFIDDSWESFFTLARSSSIKMLSLDLSGNKFGNEGAAILSTCLNNVKQLILKGCNITAPGVEIMSKKIRELNEQMLSLDLSGNKFGNEGAAILTNCLNNVKQLILQGCDITTPGVKAISNKIRELHEPMLSLDLSLNELGNEGAAVLTNCLNNVKQLILSRCDITTPGVEAISNKIRELDEPVIIESLNFHGNKVGNRGFFAISSCLDKIVKLRIGSYDDDSELTMEGIKNILSANEKTPNPLLELMIYCGSWIEKEAKKEARKYQLNIWINWAQVSFKVENVKNSEENLSEHKKQVESDSSSNVSTDEIEAEEKYFSCEEINSDCFLSDDSTELYETAQEFHNRNQLNLKAISLKKHLVEEAQRRSEIYLPQFVCNKDITNDQISSTLLFHSIGLNKDHKSWEIFQENISSSDLIDLIFDTVSDKKSVIQQSNLSVLIGDAGSGKTSFLKVLLNDYAKNEKVLGYDFIFVVDYPYADVNRPSSLLEFLAKNLPHSWIKDSTTSLSILDEVEKNSKICVILENFNLQKISSGNKTSYQNDKTHIPVEMIVEQIVTGKLLPKAKVMITLRPYQSIPFINAFSGHKTFLRILVDGVDRIGRKNICISLSNTENESVLSYIQSYPELETFCNLPANCYAVMQILFKYIDNPSQYFSESTLQEIEKPGSHPLFCFPLTSVFVPSLVLKLWIHGLRHNKCSLLETVKFIGKDFPNHKCFFTPDDMAQETFNEVANVFLHLCPPTSKKDEFLISFQAIAFDCFVAIYLMYFQNFSSDTLELVNYKNLQKDSRSLSIVKFLYGINTKIVKKYLKILLSEQPELVNSEVSQTNLTLLKELLLVSYDSDKEESTFSILLLCSLVFEMQDEILTCQIAENLSENLLIKTCNSAQEIAGLAYVLSKRQKRMTICIAEKSKNHSWVKKLKEYVSRTNSNVHFSFDLV